MRSCMIAVPGVARASCPCVAGASRPCSARLLRGRDARGTHGRDAHATVLIHVLRSHVLVTCCLLALGLADAFAAEATSGDLAVGAARDGGLIDSLRYKGREVLRAEKGLVAAAVTLAPAGDGTAESLLAHRAGEMLAAAVEDVRADANVLTVKGAYADGPLRVPFTRRIALDGGQRTVHVTEEADFGGLGERAVAKHALSLPLAVCKDPHLRMLAFGGAGRAEMFRMDMNDVNRGGQQLISAPRGHRPYWDIGGVQQLAGSYRIWKANHADTPAYPVDEGAGSPGWADYSEPDWGLTVVVDGPARRAPWSVEIDARKGLLTVAPHPASQLPTAAKALGKRSFGFRLVLHDTSWPATHPCELELSLYRALLKDMATGSRAPSPWVLSTPVGTADIDTIIVRERIQPSVMLRTLYRGDAWQMQGRMKTIGLQTPRNQPLAAWDACARQYLEHIRKHGLPKRGGD
ncbi:MAG TPA: hypothetical protein VM695_03445 [Phycisphaerae bacterium]|nr:hypothetical protein [Phycisphaerae bacterium]